MLIEGTPISLFSRAPRCDSETQTPGLVGNSISVIMGPDPLPQGCTKRSKGLNQHLRSKVLGRDSSGASFLTGFSWTLGAQVYMASLDPVAVLSPSFARTGVS